MGKIKKGLNVASKIKEAHDRITEERERAAEAQRVGAIVAAAVATVATGGAASPALAEAVAVEGAATAASTATAATVESVATSSVVYDRTIGGLAEAAQEYGGRFMRNVTRDLSNIDLRTMNRTERIKALKGAVPSIQKELENQLYDMSNVILTEKERQIGMKVVNIAAKANELGMTVGQYTKGLSDSDLSKYLKEARKFAKAKAKAKKVTRTKEERAQLKEDMKERRYQEMGAKAKAAQNKLRENREFVNYRNMTADELNEYYAKEYKEVEKRYNKIKGYKTDYSNQATGEFEELPSIEEFEKMSIGRKKQMAGKLGEVSTYEGLTPEGAKYQLERGAKYFGDNYKKYSQAERSAIWKEFNRLKADPMYEELDSDQIQAMVNMKTNLMDVTFENIATGTDTKPNLVARFSPKISDTTGQKKRTTIETDDEALALAQKRNKVVKAARLNAQTPDPDSGVAKYRKTPQEKAKEKAKKEKEKKKKAAKKKVKKVVKKAKKTAKKAIKTVNKVAKKLKL